MNVMITDDPVAAGTLVISALIALFLGLLLPVPVRRVLVKQNMVDIPTERSSHRVPTYRGMGLATAVAAITAYIVALASGMIPSDRLVAIAVLVGMVCSCVLGWLEDIRGVSILVRFGMQVLIGLIVTSIITYSLGTSFIWIPLGVLAVAAFINVVNFMDGVNGMSGIYGGVVGGFYAYAGIINHIPWLAVGGLAVALAYLAFLPWNILPGRNVFLGDAGSYFLGGAVASMAIGAFLSGVYVEYLLPPMLVYLADTGFTLAQRVARGEQWYKPHRTHVYQKLTDLGFSHVGSALTVAGFTTAITVISIVALPSSTQTQLWAGAAVILLLALYLCLPLIFASKRGAKA